VRISLKPRSLALLAGIAGMAVFCSLQMQLESNVTKFMPDGGGSELAALSRQLADSELTRTMILAIRGPSLPISLEAGEALAARLRENDEVKWVRNGVDPMEIESLYELYFPRRHYFLSDDPEHEIPLRLSTPALVERARALKRELASPGAFLFKRIAAADPLGAFADVVSRVRDERPTLRLEGNRFVSLDGDYAILMLATRASAFDHGRQVPLLAEIRRDVDDLSRELEVPLTLEQSGTNRFAADAQSAIRGDVYVVCGLSFLGVALVFMTLVGSLRAFVIVFLPTLTGILVAISVGLIFFGGFDGLTLAFGTVLIGVATDYSVHALVHHRLATGGETASATLRRLRPTLFYGAITTIASFVGLAFTSFPAFREISTFSIVGLAASLATTFFVLPELLDLAPPLPRRARRMAERLGGLGHGVGRPLLWQGVPAALCVVLFVFAVPRIRWVDDMSAWTRIDPELLAEDQRVRSRVTPFDTSRFVVVLADDEQTAIAMNSRVRERLEPLLDDGGLTGVRSLHALLWSEDLQRRNLRALLAEEDLYPRVVAAFAKEGFQADAFEPFGEALASEPPAPLTLADLRDSSLGPLLSSMVIPLDRQLAVITHLRGIESISRVAQALDGLEGVRVFEQRAFLNDVYAEFRSTTAEQIVVGSLLVAAILLARYRRLRPALAALLPSILVALTLIDGFAFLGTGLNLLHVMTLIMVLGMGVDYGIFIVDTAHGRTDFGVTFLSLLVSCLTTFLVFGTLAVASQPVLRAVGTTAGVGILLAFFYSPLALLVLGRPGEEARRA